MFVVGVYDDFYNADFKLKFLLQIIVAKILIDQGLIIDHFHGVLGLPPRKKIHKPASSRSLVNNFSSAS